MNRVQTPPPPTAEELRAGLRALGIPERTDLTYARMYRPATVWPGDTGATLLQRATEALGYEPVGYVVQQAGNRMQVAFFEREGKR